VRPKISIETKGLEQSLHDHLGTELAKGPLAESEIWEVALEYLTPRLPSMSSTLIQNYRIQFGRKIGKKTAEKNIMTHMRLLLSKVKKGFLHTERPVIAGGKRFGRVFYARGQEGKLQAKVRELVKKGGGIQQEVVDGVNKGPVKKTPRNSRAIGLLAHYGIVERRRIGGAGYAVTPGYNPVDINEPVKAGKFPDHYKTWKPLKIDAWVLRDGPEKVGLKFDLAAWDPVNKQFFVAVDRDYVGLNHLKAFRERHMVLGLPARMLVFCGEISDSARKYAERWGMEIREYSAPPGKSKKRQTR
jgi:hypothetical protein